MLVLAIISISDAGFSRIVGLFFHSPTSFFGTYLFFEGGSLLIILLMFLWDWRRDRIMKQFLWGASFIIAVGLTATSLFSNETWRSISRSLLESWGRHML